MLKRIISTLAVFAVLCCTLVFPASADDAIKGYETEIENDFIPDHLQTDTQRNITREEFCATLVSLYEYISKKPVALPSENPFTDTDNPDVLKAYQLGIIKGVGSGLYVPGQELNVEQKAVMLYNTLILLDPSINSDISQGTEGAPCDFNDAGTVSVWAVEAIEYLYHHGIINVDKDANINPIASVAVDSANFHAQDTLEHYNDLTVLPDSEQTPLLGAPTRDTLVTRADGYLVRINEVRISDEILAPNGLLVKIENIVHGRVSSVVEIKYGDGGSISVSGTKPLMTEAGLIPAKNLRPSNKLLDKDGNLVEVLLVYRTQQDDTDYQLILDTKSVDYKDHLYMANEIVIGDFYTESHM